MGRRRALGLSLALVLVAAWSHGLPRKPSESAAAVRSRSPSQLRSDALRSFSQLPLSFEANRGQAGAGVRFLSRTSDSTVLLSPNKIRVLLPVPVRGGASKRPLLVSQTIRLLGTHGATHINGQQALEGRVNYFIG